MRVLKKIDQYLFLSNGVSKVVIEIQDFGKRVSEFSCSLEGLFHTHAAVPDCLAQHERRLCLIFYVHISRCDDCPS